MPHNYPAALKAHLAQRHATVAVACVLTRKDGLVLGMTSHRRSVELATVLHRPQPGLVASALMSRSSMSIDNAQVTGFIQDDAISDRDLRGGMWESARMSFFIYNYEDPHMGTGFLGNGIIGNCKIGSDGMWTVEFRSLEQMLAQEIGQVTSVTCRYKRLGRDGCPVNVLGNDALGRAITRIGSITSNTDNAVFSTNLSNVPNHFFKGGVIKFTSGDNESFEAHIYDSVGSTLTLWQEMPLPVQPGDTFSAEEGCDRRVETCFTNFNSVWAIAAEPFIPGPENIYTITEA